MLQQIHKQNQLHLHSEHEIELEVYQILYVDPMPIITKILFTVISHITSMNLLE
jgi:hypothetical protein